MIKDKCKWVGDTGETILQDEHERKLAIVYYYRSGLVYCVEGELSFLIHDNMTVRLPLKHVKKYVETQIELFIETIS